MKSASGLELHTFSGRKFVDFTAGYHVSNLGYAHPDILKATREQLEDLDFLPHFLGLSPLRVELAEKLRSVAPPGLRDGMVAYCNTGSDAAEFAIKLARFHTGRHALVACLGAYHGGTLGGLSITFDSSKLRKRVGPFLSDSYYVSYPNPYHFEGGPRECADQSLGELERIFDSVVDPSEVAAFFVEPIQSHGGVIIPPAEFLVGLKKICKDEGILLVADEVVTGFGRTGKMFGIEHFGVEPDVMFFGKPMGAGLPLGALLGRKEVMEGWNGEGPASTLAASLLACARSLTMIKVIERDGLLQHSTKVGRKIMNRLSEIAGRKALIGDVRGKGLLIGVELVKDRKSKKPAAKEARAVAERCYSKGLIVSAGGGGGNVIRLSPPLILSEAEADDALDIMEGAFSAV